MINLNQLEVKGDVSSLPRNQEQLKEIVRSALVSTLKEYADARNDLEQSWMKAYYAYSTSRAARRYMTAEARQVIGQVKTKWRHTLKSPKAFETVETITAYLMGAYFPNQKWFDFGAAGHTDDPNFRTVLELNRKFIDKKLNEARFKDVYRMHLREVCITGTSAFMFPWHEAMQNSKFDVISCFSLWLDPTKQHPNDANLIRKYTLEIAEVMIEKEFFNLVTEEELKNRKSGRSTIQDKNLFQKIKLLQGIQELDMHSNTKIDIFEFWGDLLLPKHNIILKNIRANFTTDFVLNLQANPFVQRPIVVTNYVQLAASPYGISALKPVLPQLYYKDVMTSRHADAVVSSVDPTYEYLHDGVVDPSKVYIAPGHKIPVTKMESVRPVPLGGNMNASVQDMSIIEQTIDKAVGTGPFIGVGQGRAAERVTKAEIDAQIAAGGNRLNDVYAHIELTLLDFLKSYREYFRAYFNSVGAVEVRQMNKGMPLFNEDIWAAVTPESFQFDVEIKPLGAGSVATKEFKLRQLFEWLSIVGQNQQMAQQVNWSQVLQYLTFVMLPDEAGFFLVTPEQQAAAQQAAAGPASLEQQATDVLRNAGAGADVKALQAAAQAGTIPAAIQQITPQL